MSIPLIFEALESTGLPAAYSHFEKETQPPFVVYTGAGQNQTHADNEIYFSENVYQVEYYFTEKDEEDEAAIEKALTDSLFTYTKSEDVYIEDQDLFVIYYDVARKGLQDG